MKTTQPHLARCSRSFRRNSSFKAFTLVELLVCIAIIAVLAGLLSSTLARAKSRARTIICLNNIRQMGLSWSLYTHDYDDRIPPNSEENSSSSKTWVQGWLNFNDGHPDNTNQVHLRESLLWPYHQTVKIWRCPADRSWSRQSAGIFPRVRSYAMNQFLNPRCQYGEWNTMLQTTSLVEPPPSQTFVFIDERDESINNGVFRVNMERTSIEDWPGIYHDRASNFYFADGHSESKRWLDPRTAPPTAPQTVFYTGGTPSHGNSDVLWLQQRTTGSGATQH